MSTTTAGEVIRANVQLHRAEAPYYERIHEEIFNPIESVRIDHRLKRAVKALGGVRGRALDFGAGTGNIARRLSRMGFGVVAFELSREMILQLKGKKEGGKIHAVLGERLPFRRGSFSLVCAFSVLHHVPDYVAVVAELASLLEPGGVLYLDHEVDPQSPMLLPRREYDVYSASASVLAGIRRRLTGFRAPHLDYSIADFHTKQEDHVEWARIRSRLRDLGMVVLEERPYLMHSSWIPNPLFPFLSFWLADLRYMIAARL